ncbi:hypothetical protein DAEQUDRAFT_484081 [Daedalea quercina L-15889]|uniref:Uncharacterized protein n=1 Tax=Daedalea quercina L-15889 TaxID=1314783 RepID=A0A165MSL5_9APHY|nr:hypothetical protein DAEQUDRAFT_484081 [Daedalea quercina L-15889]
MPTFLSTLPAGPIWNATYSSSSNVSSSSDESASGSISEDVDNVPKQGTLSKGKIAAAVIMTLLAVAGIVAGVYIWRTRKRGQEKRKRFSVAVDKRMSTISSDWRSVTTAGATHAIRSSVYGGDRTSTLDSGHAGIGAQSLRLETTEEELAAPAMAQIRPGFRASTYSAADRQSRISRVSFAPDTRPSSEYRRTRAFHNGHVPPLPDTVMSPAELSPTQTSGPFSLSAEDIRAYMAGEDASRSSIDDAVAPALSMMRTGSSPSDDSYVIPAIMKMPEPELPMPPAPVVQAPSAPQSPILGAMPMPSIPGVAMTPDDMLRAYAQRSLSSPPPSVTPPPPYSGGMRQLYSQDPTPATLSSFGLVSKPTPPSPASLYPDMPLTFSNSNEDEPRGSFAVSEESTYGVENAEHGTAI